MFSVVFSPFCEQSEKIHFENEKTRFTHNTFLLCYTNEKKNAPQGFRIFWYKDIKI